MNFKDNKTLNVLELEAELEKNLSVLKKLNEMTPDQIEVEISRLPLTNETPYKQSVPVTQPEKPKTYRIPVVNLTPDEQQVLLTIFSD